MASGLGVSPTYKTGDVCAHITLADDRGPAQGGVAEWLRTFCKPNGHVIGVATHRTQVCKHHDETKFRLEGKRWRCVQCRTRLIDNLRKRNKRALVEEAGGCCQLCGYDKCLRALEFHHTDPTTKAFALGKKNLASPLATLRKETAKCILLCANCHAEVEDGTTRLDDGVVT